MYQQSMMRAEEIRRRRREDPPGTHTAVNNILAAAAREMEEAMHASRGGERVVASIQTEHDQGELETKISSIVLRRNEFWCYSVEDLPTRRGDISWRPEV